MRRTITALCLLAAATALSACSGPGQRTETQPSTVSLDRETTDQGSFRVRIGAHGGGGEHE